MAKQKPEVNKSAAVREILTTNPKTPVSKIVATLKQQGITVSSTYVYVVKNKFKSKKRQEKKQKAVARGTDMGIGHPVELIRGVKSLADKAGGMHNLKQLVDVLAE